MAKDGSIVYGPADRFLPLDKRDVIIEQAAQTRGPHLLVNALTSIFTKSVKDITEEDKINIQGCLNLLGDMASGKCLQPSEQIRNIATTWNGKKAEDRTFLFIDQDGSSQYLRNYATFFNRLVNDLGLAEISKEYRAYTGYRPPSVE